MTEPNFRALCQELMDEAIYLGSLPYEQDPDHDLIVRARAALAQPEPVVLTRPDCFNFAMDFLGGTEEVEVRNYIERIESAARAAMEAQPEPQGPADEEPTDQEIEEWADAAAEVPLEEMDPEVHGWRRCFKSDEFSETIRAALRHWRRPAIEPEGPSERIISIAKAVQKCAFGWEPDVRVIGNVCAEDVADLCSAVLARYGRPAIEPVPVSERLPGPEDCDAEGRCWWWYPPRAENAPTYGYWAHEDDATDRAHHEWPAAWLPHWALPVPGVEGADA